MYVLAISERRGGLLTAVRKEVRAFRYGKEAKAAGYGLDYRQPLSLERVANSPLSVVYMKVPGRTAAKKINNPANRFPANLNGPTSLIII